MNVRMLISFHYYRTTDIDALVEAFPTKPELFADSGAFSAYSQGAEVQLADYAGWLDRWRHHFSVAANLDVIQNPAASVDNQHRLEDMGHPVIPVFHGAEPWEYLDGYLADGYQYVALGGMVASEMSAVQRWLVKAFVKAREAGAFYHGFGMTRQEVLSNFPWYSVDSSSWGSGHRYGQLNLWDARRRRFAKVSVGDHAAVYRHASLIRLHGGDPARLAQPGFGLKSDKDVPTARGERAEIIACNARAWMLYEGWLRERHGPIGPPSNTGPKVYLADGNDRGRDLALAGPKIYLADTRGSKGHATENPDLAIFARMAGPKIYLTDGHPDHLKQAGLALHDS